MKNLETTTLTSSLTPFRNMSLAIAPGTYVMTAGMLWWYVRRGKHTKKPPSVHFNEFELMTEDFVNSNVSRTSRETKREEKRTGLWERTKTAAKRGEAV